MAPIYHKIVFCHYNSCFGQMLNCFSLKYYSYDRHQNLAPGLQAVESEIFSLALGKSMCKQSNQHLTPTVRVWLLQGTNDLIPCSHEFGCRAVSIAPNSKSSTICGQHPKTFRHQPCIKNGNVLLWRHKY